MPTPTPPLGQLALFDRQHTSPTPSALRLETNALISAGAGAGKTYQLISLALHALLGARHHHPPVPPERLVLLTFTQKAALEMRERLERRLLRIASGEDSALDLKESFAAVGKPFPDAQGVRATANHLHRAFIGTFHAYCMRLLRTLPPRAFAREAVRLLDEAEAEERRRMIVEDVLLQALDAGDPHLTALVRAVTFGTAGRSGLVDDLLRAVNRLREEGQTEPATVDVATATRRFEAALSEAQTLCGALLHTYKGKSLDKLQTLHRMLQTCTLTNTVERWAEMAGLTSRFSGELAPLRDYVRRLDPKKESPDSVIVLHAAAAQLAPFERAMAQLIARCIERIATAFEREGLCDYTQLLIQTRNLLADDVAMRRQVQGSIAVLLVDEVQDTNRLQFEMVKLLSETRAGAPRPIASRGPQRESDLVALPVEPAFLAVVGDKKQSIYDFRGADVAVFEKLRVSIASSGGHTHFLKVSYRSSAGVLASVNQLSAHAFTPPVDVADFDVVYQPKEDDLSPSQRTPPVRPPLVQLTAADTERSISQLRHSDAEACARYLAFLLRDAAQVTLDKTTGVLRPIHGGDCVVLLQRMTQVETYRQALRRYNIPHRVLNGRGFLQSPEVKDVTALLSLVENPDDSIALASVLRGPLAFVSDETLLRLAVATRGLTLSGLWTAASDDGIAEGERGRLADLLSTLSTVLQYRPSASVAQLLELCLQTFSLRAHFAATEDAPQALANVEHLLRLARLRDERGNSLADFVQQLRGEVPASDLDAQADIDAATYAHCVTVCTVHQAKGLEWPTVILPELFASQRNEGGRVLVDRTAGLALRPFEPAHADVNSLQCLTLQRLKKKRRDAEHRRLFYVAYTRAREQLVLGLLGGREGSWASVVSTCQWHDTAPTEVALESLPTEPLPRPQPPPVVDLQVTVDSVRARAARPAHFEHLSAEELAAFAFCPQYFVHRVLHASNTDTSAPLAGPTQRRLVALSHGVERFDVDFQLAVTPAAGTVGLLTGCIERLHLQIPADASTGQGVLAVSISQQSPWSASSLQSVRALFVLQCAALAAHRLHPTVERVASTVLVRHEDEETAVPIDSSVDIAAAEQHLATQWRELNTAADRGLWNKKPRQWCEAASCEFISRCHRA
jgi:ATP-dependent helicase/nuclease subunit A